MVVGFPRFRAALYDIIYRFTPYGKNFSPERDKNPDVWKKLLGHGVAPVVVMAIETCRFRWGDDDMVRLLIEEEFAVRYVSRPEGKMLNSWDHISVHRRKQGVVWQKISRIPEDYENASSGEGNKFISRDCYPT